MDLLKKFPLSANDDKIMHSIDLIETYAYGKGVIKGERKKFLKP